MNRLIWVVDAINDIFQLMYLHNDYIIPIMALRCGEFEKFMEASKAAYLKYQDMKFMGVNDSTRYFINSLEQIDKVK